MSAPATISSGSVLLTADGVVGVSGQPVRVYAVHVVSGGTAAVVTLRNGTSASATAWAMLTSPAVSTGSNSDFGTYGMLFPNGLFVDFDANTTSVVVSYCQ